MNVNVKVNSKQKQALPTLNGHIALRLATRTDVPAIQRCNLATLPENYSSNFYVNHLRQWPDLALVAEHIVDDPSHSTSGGRNPFESYDPTKPQNEIIGYVLGKVEETAIMEPSSSSSSSLSPSRVLVDADEYFGNYLNPRERETEMLGHVTSLAVLPTFRRRGLAGQLMKQLHYHMDAGHRADGVSLHVRVSNVAARRLYCEGMGYGVVDVIRAYYQDGEDAFFMKKNFIKNEGRAENNGSFHRNNMGSTSSTLSRFSLSRMRRRASNGNAGFNSNVWENGPEEFRLPRPIPSEKEKRIEERQVREHVRGGISDLKRGVVDDVDSSQDQVMTGSL
jgi:ribosomal protein S18 acetylase RimI-like enzyme